MRVGVISDTHGRLQHQAYEALADCDHIIHAGDIGDPTIIRELETLAPVTAVLGNNDFPEYGKNVGRYANVELDGVRFLVAHYPQDVQISKLGNSALAPGDPIPDVFIHGHTHVPRLESGPEARPASYVLNPGSASRARGGFPRSIAKIDLKNGSIQCVRIEALSGELIMESEPWHNCNDSGRKESNED